LEPAEDERIVGSLFGTEAYTQSRRDRKKVEMQFAHLKRILRLNRLRLRGPLGAKDEFLHAATVQNLRKLAKLLIRPPPVQVSTRSPHLLPDSNRNLLGGPSWTPEVTRPEAASRGM